MKPNTKRNIIIWTSVAAILGVGGYFAYTKIIKPFLDKRKAAKDAANAPAAVETPATTSTSTPSAPSDKNKTQEQMKGEAISRGEHAYKWWDSYLGKWRYYTTGKNAKNGMAIKPDVEVMVVQPIPPATSKGAITNFQKFLNSIGASISTDGIFGLNTAKAAVYHVGGMKPNGDGWKLNDLQKSIAA